MSQTDQRPGPGCLVEYMLGNQPHLAWVRGDNGNSLSLLTPTGKEMKLAAGRALPWAGPCYSPESSREDILKLLTAHERRRNEAAALIDAGELWEIAGEEVEAAPASFFAELLGQSPDPDAVAAAGRALLACKTHFKFDPPDFHLLTPEQVERRRAEAERARLRERLVSEGREFVKALWNAPKDKAPAPPEDEETSARLADMLRALVRDPEDKEAAPLWRELRKGLPDHPHQPLLLAEKWGILSRHHNFHLDQADFAWGDDWWSGQDEEVRRQEEAVRAELPEPAVEPRLISIDASTTRDIDDAFDVRRDGEGYAMDIALACPTFAYRFGTELDEAVRHRATSLYLPEGEAHMMPEALGCHLYSLVADEARPALLLSFRLSPTGKVLERSLRFIPVRVAENMTYERAEELAAGDPGSMPAVGYELAEKLRAGRVEDGAIVIDRPEPCVQLEPRDGDVEVAVYTKEETPRSQLLVSEAMILANRACAELGREHGLPMLHRTQDLNLPPEYAGVWSDPLDIYQAVKQMGPALLEIDPKPHRGLGLDAYAPASSPLRRYPDLINCAQLHAWATGAEPPFTRQRLEEITPRLSARLDAASRVQRFRPRYWKLLHVKQHPEITWPAVAVEENGPLVTFAVPDLQIFARAPKDLVGDKFIPGQRFLLRFGKTDPLRNEIRVAEAIEE
ncbi:ribonuclease catalytic domain-containing protein [Desulfohalovibrio reitneri]|uniref:ribonuclease catalytic domain-containing protein n=1 Tax=Desulfohalovibrio reitneri TaxID=1307759 RepID=UPI0004A73C0E|nr:ribonuclease catalytic domain-containing protein [Desulfohalovibrio reitneri]